ncbi:Glutathione S-transferase [hydrothermal vent metagenome]|uniref:Glutathione S-transferase n=1 Tax=hydrothermal vent metagenome TaxID=652676 RepID=A0A3B1ALT2_9ZZZZ
MINLYTNSDSPNAQKIAIMLAETKLPANLVNIDLTGQVAAPVEFTALSPKGSVPAIVDTKTGIKLFESTAILLYLAKKSDMLMPSDSAKQAEVMEWLMFEASRIAPSAGAWFNFKVIAPNERGDGLAYHASELEQAAVIINQRLENREYICDNFSVVDVALYPWVYFLTEFVGLSKVKLPHLMHWAENLAQRESVIRGCENHLNVKAA